MFLYPPQTLDLETAPALVFPALPLEDKDEVDVWRAQVRQPTLINHGVGTGDKQTLHPSDFAPTSALQ